MNLLAVATSALPGPPTRLDPLALFLNADIVVQIVIAGLLLASIWVWTIVVSFGMRMGGVRRRSDAFEKAFWETEDPGKLVKPRDNPSARS
jgi:biopolymer transport protein TolQ